MWLKSTQFYEFHILLRLFIARDHPVQQTILQKSERRLVPKQLNLSIYFDYDPYDKSYIFIIPKFWTFITGSHLQPLRMKFKLPMRREIAAVFNMKFNTNEI